MYVSEIAKGEVYAYIRNYGKHPNMACDSSLAESSAVRIIERVAVPKVKRDNCGRTSVINQTKFRAEWVSIPPTHMFADDLDAAIADSGVSEILVVAKDCLCSWEEEVTRARDAATRKVVADRFKDYIDALAYMMASYNAERDEIIRCSGERAIDISVSMGYVTQCVKADELVWKDFFSRKYSREYSLPSLKITVKAIARPQAATLSDNISHDEIELGMKLSKNVLFELEQAFNITASPAPARFTKKGDYRVAYSAWTTRRSDKLNKVCDKLTEMAWENRTELLELLVHRFSTEVANLLGGYYAETIQKTPFSALTPQNNFRSRQFKRFLMIADHLEAQLSESTRKGHL